MPASTKNRKKINLRFTCQNSTEAEDENDDVYSPTAGAAQNVKHQPTVENAAHRFCANNERPQDGKQNYDPSKDARQDSCLEEPANPEYPESRASLERDDQNIRKQKSGTAGKNKAPAIDILEGEIPSKAQAMSTMITSLREKVEDLNLSLDAKDEIISNYEKYIDEMKKKKMTQRSGRESARLKLVSTDEFQVAEGVSYRTEAISVRESVNYSETKDEDASFRQIENGADPASGADGEIQPRSQDLFPSCSGRAGKGAQTRREKVLGTRLGEIFQLKENRQASSEKKDDVSSVLLVESPTHGQRYEIEQGKNVECETASQDLPSQEKGKSKKKWWKRNELEDCSMDKKEKASSECQVGQTKGASLKKPRWRRKNIDLGKNERRTKSNADDLQIALRSTNEMLASYRKHIDRLTNERQILLDDIKDKCNNAEVLEALQKLNEYRCSSRDWIIERDEIHVSSISLGVGAWGTVHEGSFRGCPVAVKQIHELILSPQNRRIFEREMSIASRCRHPNLLQFIGATNDNGSPLFVTELLDTDLRRILSQQELLQDEIVCIALDVARGLNYLHLNKPFPIMHRDISSSNVLLWKRGDSWRAKLSDYGAANFMRENMTANPGAWVYSAPEARTSYQTPKVDVYSFGLLLCEMHTRELPDPTRVNEQIGRINDVCLKDLSQGCVAVDPEVRPDMSEVVGILWRVLDLSSAT